jgi:hypothetical protein
MPPTSTTNITVLISIILATSAFLATAINNPIPQIKVSEEQAISILMNNPKTDHKIVNGSTPVKADLEYVALSGNSMPDTGSQHHSRIYFSSTHTDEERPYWFFDYETNWNYGFSSGSGRYIVDAQSGELVFSVESISGSITIGGPDVLIDSKPSAYLWDSSTFFQPENFTDHALVTRSGQFTPLVLKVSAPTYYDAVLPVSVKVVRVSSGFSVSQNVTSSILRSGGSAFFLIQVFTPVTNTLGSGSDPQMVDKVPHMDVEFTLLASNTTFSIFFSES